MTEDRSVIFNRQDNLFDYVVKIKRGDVTRRYDLTDASLKRIKAYIDEHPTRPNVSMDYSLIYQYTKEFRA